jgi:hypothetical protein
MVKMPMIFFWVIKPCELVVGLEGFAARVPASSGLLSKCS